jgi:hypothetical protein
MTSDHPGWLPDTPEGIAAWAAQVKPHPDQSIAEGEVPPVLSEGEDAMVPRSFKIPFGLDEQLSMLAATRGVSKSELIRRYLEAAVATELTQGQGSTEVFIPLADALRALTGLRHLPRTA